MYHARVFALVNPFSPLVKRTEWDTVTTNHFSHHEAADEDHTIKFHLGAAELREDNDIGLCLPVSATLPTPEEVKSAIIGYKVKLEGIEKKMHEQLISGAGTRYRHGGAIGIVLSYCSPSIEVEGPDRDEAVALAFAILEGSAQKMSAALQEPQVPAGRQATKAPVSARLSDLPAGTQSPTDATRAMCG